VRQYEPIWIQIKTEFKCEISAHKAHHRRIIKAVTKEKDMDLGYKLYLSELIPPQHALMYSKSKGSIITFTLKLNETTRPPKEYFRHITLQDI
jgi:hypothetical protein